jgi:hypothetical protein
MDVLATAFGSEKPKLATICSTRHKNVKLTYLGTHPPKYSQPRIEGRASNSAASPIHPREAMDKAIHDV